MANLSYQLKFVKFHYYILTFKENKRSTMILSNFARFTPSMSESNIKVKVAPNSKDAEMMVLGCMLTSINAMNISADSLDDTDFYYTEHKIIFQVLKTAYKNDKPADVHLVAEELKRQDKLKAVGGISYLTTLAQYAGTSAFIEEYTEIIRNKAILRNMIHAAQLVEKNSLEEPQDVSACLDEAQQLFYKISQAVNSGSGFHIKDIFSGLKAESGLPYLKELQERQEEFAVRGKDAPAITGIPTNLIDLDKLLNGLNKSNLMIVAARPAMGKTAFALNIAENVCFKHQIPVGVFSLEMSAEQLVHRIVCSQAEVESDKIKTGAINGIEYQRIVAAVNEMQKCHLIIDDQPGLKITDLRARARRMKETYQIGLLIIDYLQLLSGSGSRTSGENRQNEISEISRMLKNLARELDIPIICLSQLSRKVEERPGHRPVMSDLRESGSIEQDSDVVMFLLRREYYDPNDKPGLAEVIVAKNRHGAIGTVNLTYRKEIVQFANYIPIQKDYSESNRESEAEFDRFSP
jgi:replicative DNA helicase